MIIRYFLISILFMHGLAHITEFIVAWTNLSPSKFLSAVLWLIACITLGVAAVGLLRRSGWGSGLAIAGVTLSLLVIVLNWKTIPPGAKVGAAFDILVLVGLLSPIREWIAKFL